MDSKIPAWAIRAALKSPTYSHIRSAKTIEWFLKNFINNLLCMINTYERKYITSQTNIPTTKFDVIYTLLFTGKRKESEENEKLVKFDITDLQTLLNDESNVEEYDLHSDATIEKILDRTELYSTLEDTKENIPKEGQSN